MALIIFVILSLIPPTSLGKVVKSCNISPGFAFSGHTPIKNVSLIFNFSDFEIIDIISSSINPGSIVLSTITSDFGDNNSESFAPTVLNAE